MFRNLSIVQKQVVSNLIDLVIPLIPVLYSFYVRKIILFDFLTFFEVSGIVFLISNILFYLIGKGITVGENLTQINLIDNKSGKTNHIKNICRIFLIGGFIFYFDSFENFEYEMFVPFLLLIIPIKFVKNGFNIYSILNVGLGIRYLERVISKNINAT